MLNVVYRNRISDMVFIYRVLTATYEVLSPFITFITEKPPIIYNRRYSQFHVNLRIYTSTENSSKDTNRKICLNFTFMHNRLRCFIIPPFLKFQSYSLQLDWLIPNKKSITCILHYKNNFYIKWRVFLSFWGAF